MQMNDKKLIKIAATAGACALVLSLTFFESKRREFLHIKDPVVVLTAAGDIARDSVLSKEDILTKKIPREFVEPGAITKTEDALGSIVLVDILRGEQLTRAKAAPAGRRGGLAAFVPDKMRAVSVELQNDAAVAGLIKPGDLVDVIAVFELHNGSAARQGAHAVSLGNMVLAVGSDVSNRRYLLGGDGKKEKGIFNNDERERKTFVVTLAAPPDEAVKIALAKETGAVSLLLRPPERAGASQTDDLVERNIRPATLGDIAGSDASFGAAKRFREYRGR